MKIGDIVWLHESRRRNGKYAGKTGLVVDFGKYNDVVLNICGELKSVHQTQLAGVLYES